MSVDYFVAVHSADWPTPAALNRCMTALHYPVSVSTVPPAEVDKPLAIVPNTLGLVMEFEGKPVELEASVTKLGPGHHRWLPEPATTTYGPPPPARTISEHRDSGPLPDITRTSAMPGGSPPSQTHQRCLRPVTLLLPIRVHECGGAPGPAPHSAPAEAATTSWWP